MKFAIIDVNNLVHRAKHTVSNYDSFDACVAMTLDRLFGSLRKVYEKFGAEHCVACFDSYSWRKDVFPDYKGDRDYDSSPIKLEEREIIKEVLINLQRFLVEHTNVTVLSRKGVEADDFIARWVQLHDDPEFTHIIVSADGDFKQLVREGVELFNPISYTLYTTDGVYSKTARDLPMDEMLLLGTMKFGKLSTTRRQVCEKSLSQSGSCSRSVFVAGRTTYGLLSPECEP